MDLATAVNRLARFCGLRDLDDLTRADLRAAYGLDQVDVCVLFGGSILAGGDRLAQAMQEGLARHYVIVGGAGHTTDGLRLQLANRFPDFDPAGQTEAALFQYYLARTYGLRADLLETQSTNCGNNITLLLDLLAAEGIDWTSILLIQDATMQHRMFATLKKYAASQQRIINFAAYQAEVELAGQQLRYLTEPAGMWEMDRYLSLLLGEIPRLRDDAQGYGPKGTGYLASVRIPPAVEAAHAYIEQQTQIRSREANPAFASQAEQ